MSKLKLGLLADNKAVRLTADLPAGAHGELIAYAQIFAAEPAKLIAPMLARFMDADQAITRARRASVPPVLWHHLESA